MSKIGKLTKELFVGASAIGLYCLGKKRAHDEKTRTTETKDVNVKEQKKEYIYDEAVRFIRTVTKRNYSVDEIVDIIEAEEMYMANKGIMDGTYIREDYKNAPHLYKEVR